MPRLLIPLALAGICAALLAVTVRFGSFVAGGSDSSCYVLQAERWASGRLLAPDPLAVQAPWPDAERAFAPAAAGSVPRELAKMAATSAATQSAAAVTSFIG